MLSILKVLKINLLALLALPLLLVSIAAKLIQKALEKALVFMGVGGAFLGLLLLSQIFKNPFGFFEGIGYFIAVLILFGSIIILVLFVLFMFGTVATALLTMIVAVLNSIFGFMFELSHEGYSKLYDICKCDYEELPDKAQSKYLIWGCVIWHLLRALNFIIIKLFSYALYISIAASIGLVAYSVGFAHTKVMKTFGIGIFTYLKLFPAVESVFAVLYFVVLLFGSVVVIISLGIEWSEWGMLLKASTQDYGSYSQMKLMEMDTDLLNNSFEDGQNAQHCQQYMDTLNELINEFEGLQQQVDIAMNIRQDSAVAYKFSEYASLLNEITKQMSVFKTNISCKIFERQFIPQIEKANRLSKDIIKDTMKIVNKNAFSAEENKTLDFFEGCSSEEDLKKRYKALCKVYHPDIGGHEETFKVLQNQYEEKMKAAQV